MLSFGSAVKFRSVKFRWVVFRYVGCGRCVSLWSVGAW